MRSSLLAKVRHQAIEAGLNLLGLVDAARYDACQPKERRSAVLGRRCGTIVVMGTGGLAFATRTRPAATERDMRPIQAPLAAAGVPSRVITPDLPGGLRFLCLGEAAGFGTVSPVSGLLLHPQFGPWIAIEAVMLVDGHPFGPIADASITDRFQPCCGCQRPCVSACPGDAAAVACGPTCLRRQACPLGSEHRSAPATSARVCAPTREWIAARGIRRFVAPFFVRWT